MNGAADLVARARVVLLDFDGPICSVFAGYPAARAVIATLRALEAAGFDVLPQWLTLEDPHRLLVEVATHIPNAVDIAEDALTRAEVHAVHSAQITTGIQNLIDQVTGRGQQWAVVSNNSAESITRFCTRKDFARTPSLTLGRPIGRPDLMKPHPFLLQSALDRLAVLPGEAVFVGDSVSDVRAGNAARIATVGYANKPGKRPALESEGAILVIDVLQELGPP